MFTIFLFIGHVSTAEL